MRAAQQSSYKSAHDTAFVALSDGADAGTDARAARSSFNFYGVLR